MAAKKKKLTDAEVIANFKDLYTKTLRNQVESMDIQLEVAKTIKEIAESSVMELLGLERDRWSTSNKWSVNCCNGFNKYSEIGKLLGSKVTETVEQLRGSFEVPKLTPAQEAALVKHYKEELSSRLLSIAREWAREDAEKLADTLLTRR